MLDSQEMFVLFFSILYGIMLNSLIGRGAFPITSALSGRDMVGRENDIPKWERGCTSLKRFLLSVAVLNILPLIYFAVAFQLINYPIVTSTRILSIGLMSLGVFAFYYFFLGLAMSRPYGSPIFYTQFEWTEQYKNKVFFPSTRNHVIAGFSYLLIPWIITVFLQTKGLL